MRSQVLAVCLLSLARSPVLAAETIEVPGGPFRMGCSLNDPDCDTDEGPPGGTEVKVPTFRIDKYEVSVAEYRRCMEAGACVRPKDHARNKYCNLGADGRDEHPANCVDWAEADAYCGWVGGRLPREAEWEKAARAETTGRYPWGAEATCASAILDDGVTFGSVPNEPDGCGEDRTWPRGSRAPNAQGLYDMHGNVGEWTATWYAADAIVAIYAKGNLDGPGTSASKVVRGGSWDENRLNLRSSFRNVKPPESGDSVYGSIGFRCVYDVQG